MTLDPKIARAKELAAQAAFETYSTKLTELLAAQGLTVGAALNASHHVHTGLLLDCVSREAVLVRAEWTFTADEALIARALAGVTRGAG